MEAHHRLERIIAINPVEIWALQDTHNNNNSRNSNSFSSSRISHAKIKTTALTRAIEGHRHHQCRWATQERTTWEEMHTKTVLNGIARGTVVERGQGVGSSDCARSAASLSQGSLCVHLVGHSILIASNAR
jgi:hypothetical protein